MDVRLDRSQVVLTIEAGLVAVISCRDRERDVFLRLPGLSGISCSNQFYLRWQPSSLDAFKRKLLLAVACYCYASTCIC